MRVIVNGEQREIASARVDALLGELEYEGTHFAIALNYDVLPRAAGPRRRSRTATRSRSSRRGREGEDDATHLSSHLAPLAGRGRRELAVSGTSRVACESRHPPTLAPQDGARSRRRPG